MGLGDPGENAGFFTEKKNDIAIKEAEHDKMKLLAKKNEELRKIQILLLFLKKQRNLKRQERPNQAASAFHAI